MGDGEGKGEVACSGERREGGVPRGERWANPKQWNAGGRAGGLSELIFHVAGCTMGQRSYMIITRGIRYCV